MGPDIFFILLMYTGKRWLALPRLYKISAGQVHIEEAVWAHFTSLRAFKCVHPASGVKWSRNILVKLFGAFCWCQSSSWGAGCRWWLTLSPANSTTLHNPPIVCNYWDTSCIAHPPELHPKTYVHPQNAPKYLQLTALQCHTC